MPSLTALPRYDSAVAWSELIPGVFTVGYSKLSDGTPSADPRQNDTLGEQYPKFPFNMEHDDLSERMLTMSYTRGRSDDLTEVQATSGTMEIVDDDELYNPHNVSSPIVDQLHPLRPYRVRAVGPALVPLTTNGWQIDDVVRARTVIGDGFTSALLRKSSLAFWRFDEPASETLAYEDAGGDPDVLAYPEGTSLTDAPALIAGSSGLAKTLGVGSHLVVQSGDSVNPRAGMTLIALLSLTSVVRTNDRYIFHKPTQWSLRIDTAGRLSFAYHGTDGLLVDCRTVSQIPLGSRQLCVVCWDGKSVRVWVNRVEVEVERGLLHAG